MDSKNNITTFSNFANPLARYRFMNVLQRGWRIIKKIFVILFVAQLIYILLLKWMDPPITVIQIGSWLSGNGLKRDYVAMKDISPYAGLAVMAAEDQLFPQWL